MATLWFAGTASTEAVATVDPPTLDEADLTKDLYLAHKTAVKQGLQHPGPLLLESYALGAPELSEDEATAVASHMRGCARCAKAVDTFEDHQEYFRASRARRD